MIEGALYCRFRPWSGDSYSTELVLYVKFKKQQGFPVMCMLDISKWCMHYTFIQETEKVYRSRKNNLVTHDTKCQLQEERKTTEVKDSYLNR